MQAYQCDRCGKLFSYEEYGKSVTRNGVYYILYKRGRPDAEEVKRDLCAECEESLILWMKKES